jgi:hypothetical protein
MEVEAYPGRYKLGMAAHWCTVGQTERVANLDAIADLNCRLVAAAADRGLCGMTAPYDDAARAAINWLVGGGVALNEARWMPVEDAISRLRAEAAADPPAAPGADYPLGPLEKALALLVKHPDWSDAKIAETVGVRRTTLYKPTWRKYQAAREALQAGRDDMPRGVKDGETGSVEAWDDDE